LHHLSQRVNGGQINGFALTTEGDDYLLALIGDGSPQTFDIRINTIDRPFEQALRVEFIDIPKRTLDDAHHFGKDFRPTSAQLAGMASGRDPTT
jgi:hypothetical protein